VISQHRIKKTWWNYTFFNEAPLFKDNYV